MNRSGIGSLRAFARLLLSALATVLLLATSLDARAETFGRTSVGATASGGSRAEYKRGSKFTLSQAATITQICGYVDGNGGASGTQKLRFALYRDASGKPGAKMVSTEEVNIAQGMGAKWLCLETGYLPLSAGAYWLMLHSSSPAGVMRFYFDGTGNFYGNPDAFEAGADNPFGAGAPGDGTLSLYASYVPANIWHTVGRTTVGAEARSAAYDYIRGSSFVLNETARLNTMTAYMGDTGHGFVYNYLDWILYKDENGVPKKLIYRGGTPLPTIPLDDDHLDSDLFAPRWLNAHVNPVILQPGRYWFEMHTGVMFDENVSGGVLQYFADGSGNWFGGPDEVWNGPDDPFTAGGGLGNGTISAFITYEPGPFVARKFGRTSAATHVAHTLAQNYMHASRFTLPDDGASITAINVYLDGNGGGTGHQWLRPILFNDVGAKQMVVVGDLTFVDPGKPAGWVKIPLLQPQRLPKGNYWIGLQSGSPTNVTRLYGDGPANELIRPREDAVSGTDYLDPPENPAQPGPVTLSIYADYMVPQK